MHNCNEELVLHLKTSEKEYIEMVAKQKYLSIEQFIVLCTLAFEKEIYSLKEFNIFPKE